MLGEGVHPRFSDSGREGMKSRSHSCLPVKPNKGALNSLKNLWPSDSRLNRNLQMLVFEERGKLEYPEKNLLDQRENQQQTHT